MNKAKGTARLIDVAKLAGVSKSTASRVLLGDDKVSPTALEKVTQAVNELGYVRDRAAAQLRGHHVPTIGVIIRITDSPYYSDLLAAVQKQADQSGIELLIMNGSRHYCQQAKVLRSLLERRVDGILVASGRANLGAISECTGEVPIVLIGMDKKLPQTDTVVMAKGAEKELVRRLVSAGHHQIGVLVTSQDVSWTLAGRAATMLSEIKTQGAKAVEIPILSPGEAIPFDAIVKAQNQGMSALMTGSDTQLLSILAALRTHTIQIPEDLSLTGFDGCGSYIKALGKNFVTWRQPVEQMAKQAVDLLVKRIETPGRAEQYIALPGQYVPGFSVVVH